METKNYMINDKWLDLDKQNIVELQSVDGVLDSLKVNGSEVVTPSGKITITENGTDIDVAQYALADVNVEGGGGSSDFSTAEVTIAPFDGGYTEYEYPLPGVDDVDNTIMILHPIARDDSRIFTVPLYKGKLTINTGENIGISGNFVYNSDFGELTITGDCTIKGYAMH